MASTQNLIVKAKEFKPSKVTYDPPVTNKRGGKSVNLRLNGQPIVLSVPLMLTWGINEWVDDDTGRVKYDMALQFDPEKSASQAAFLKIMKEFQEKVLNDATKDSKKYFGKKMSRAIVDALMYPMLKHRKHKDGPNVGEPDLTSNPTLKLKVSFWEGRYNCEVYDMARQPLYLPPKYGCGQEGNKAPGSANDSTPRDFVPKAAHVKGLIKCTGLWFAGGKCGCGWQLVQINVRPPTRLVGSGKCYIPEDSDDDELLDQLNKSDAQDKEDEEGFTPPTFQGSEEEEDDDEEEEEDKPPTPVKKKKKKVVRRKKKADN